LQTKWNTKSEKHSCKNNVCSQGSVMWQTDAIGLRKYDLGLPSHLLSLRQLQEHSGNFPIAPWYGRGKSKAVSILN
jgi:hypothetical protein